MKRIIFFSFCVILASCSINRASRYPYYAVYNNEGVGEIMPSYIILRSRPHLFESYDPNTQCSTFGEWKTKNDTLLLTPFYLIAQGSSGLHASSISQQDTSFVSIPMAFLVGKDYIVDITDYSVVWPDIEDSLKIVYKRVILH